MQLLEVTFPLILPDTYHYESGYALHRRETHGRVETFVLGLGICVFDEGFILRVIYKCYIQIFGFRLRDTVGAWFFIALQLLLGIYMRVKADISVLCELHNIRENDYFSSFKL